MADKTRRITKKDWKRVEQKLKKELDARKSAKCRTDAERKWKEVDRQLQLETMTRVKRDISQEEDWRNVVELGELSTAVEIIKAGT